ncbi:MAG: cation:proton antiporter [Leptolyngbyaceae cyanobacterium bins.59]|nr:cation:proton antiporter [Leptolyngbyaceae cyanobacterium bins.59]
MSDFLHVLQEPIVSFSILLAVILTIPPLVERLKLPGLVGLLAAGVLLGPNGLHLLDKSTDTMRLLSEIGLLYLMFVAGLEVDMVQFQRMKYQSMGFGSLTFIVPMITGTLVGQLFGFSLNASILLGSILASHTLLAYPLVSRLGVVNNRAVMVTIGATIFTDVGALLVLAVCVGIHGGNFTIVNLITLLLSLVIYSAVVLFGFDWAGREFFRRSGDDEGNQFLFVLLAIFLASFGAELIGVEKIVGAFLAGLAVNGAVGEGPVKEKVTFVGNVLFIPFFFINIGLLIDVQAFIRSTQSMTLMLAIVGGLVASKFIAAFLTKLIYRFNQNEMLVMWSLSLPQVGATLAATLVGYEVGLLNEEVLNGVIVMMLVTSTLGPLITSRTAPNLITEATLSEPALSLTQWERSSDDPPYKVVVPVYNPQTERHLIEMAALLARSESGRIVSLSIATVHTHLDAPELKQVLQRGDVLLERAREMGEDLGVPVDPILRIDDGIAQAISRASREQNACLIVMGWGRRTGLRAKLFGNVIDSVLWSAHCPVAVSRLLTSPTEFRRILVPIENLTLHNLGSVRFAQILAENTQGQVTLLHVVDRHTSSSRLAWIKSQLSLLVSRLEFTTPLTIEVVAHDSIAHTILNFAKDVDLVVMRSVRYRNSGGGLNLSDVTTEVVRHINCSIVLLGEPQRPVVLNETQQEGEGSSPLLPKHPSGTSV